MAHCLPKSPLPCIQYDTINPDDLQAFLVAHGGQKASFQKNGTADILTLTNGEPRFIYLNPTSWLRSLGEGRFMAHSDTYFTENFTLV